MVELGNHQGRPPGCESTITSSSLMDQWMNREINLDFLEQSRELYPNNGGFQPSSDLYAVGGGSATIGNGGDFSTVEPTLEEIRFDSPIAFDKNLFDIDGTVMNESLNQFGGSNEMFKDITDKLPCEEPGIHGFQSWGAPMDIDGLKLEEVYQVDESDLVQGPTLAELNSNDDPFFDLEFGYDLAKDFNQCNNAQSDAGKVKCTVSNSMSPNNLEHVSVADVKMPVGILVNKPVKAEPDKPECLTPEKVLKIPKIKVEMEDNANPNMTPVKKVQLMNRIPTLAPAHIVAARLAGRERQRSGLSISSISSLSSLSNDEGFGSQAEEDDDDDDSEAEGSSDEDSYIGHSSKSRSKSSSSDLNRPTTSGVVSKSSKSKSSGRKKRYFWQYNIQSKGPKVCIPSQVLPGNALDPHILDDALDPVFSPECSLEGVKHAGKARRGDGNDLTPCPRKLHNIGLELSSLNDMINDLTPVNDVPFNARPKSRKEKNKLASRACRLKKKAQHEANKLKLYGLQKEHKTMVTLIPEVRQMLRELLSLDNLRDNKQDLKSSHFQDVLNKLLAGKTYVPVAGNTAEFVNQVLDKVAAGDPNGGLNDL